MATSRQAAGYWLFGRAQFEQQLVPRQFHLRQFLEPLDHRPFN